MSQEYDYWLLDLDGTVLTVTDEYVQRTMSTVADHLDTRFRPREARRIWYGRDGLRDELLADHGIDPERFWSVFHRIESPNDRARATRLHPDAHAILGLEGPRGVVTHCQWYLTEPILDELGIHDWFDTVVCCSDTLGWKPDPSPVHFAMDSLGVNGEQGVLVGDSLADVQAAHNAGLDAILVQRDGEVFPTDADLVIDSLDALTAVTSGSG